MTFKRISGGLLRIAALASISFIFAAAAGETRSEDYPTRPIRLIVPFTPGGGTDIAARTLAPRFSQGVGQQIVVDNRPGAGGAVGAELAAKAPPDGYTIWIGQTANLAIGPALRKKPLYDPVRDFAPITMIQKSPSVIVVAAASPLKSLQDLIAMAKKNPQGVTYGSAGVGTAGHITGYLISRAAGIDMTHVPYKGASPAMLDLQAGRISLMATSSGSAAGMIRQGKIRALGTTGAKRARLLPDVPTLAEQGLRGFDVTSWLAMLAPAKTPAPYIARLNKELVRVLGLPEIQEKLMTEGGDVTPTSPEEAAAFIRSEVAKWSKALKDADIPVE
jgi:tripartite-type tricarboxylate transporter receptor subunit TctC